MIQIAFLTFIWVYFYIQWTLVLPLPSPPPPPYLRISHFGWLILYFTVTVPFISRVGYHTAIKYKCWIYWTLLSICFFFSRWTVWIIGKVSYFIFTDLSVKNELILWTVDWGGIIYEVIWGVRVEKLEVNAAKFHLILSID